MRNIFAYVLFFATAFLFGVLMGFLFYSISYLFISILGFNFSELSGIVKYFSVAVFIVFFIVFVVDEM